MSRLGHTAAKVGGRGPDSNASMIMFATLGCLSRITEMESAQLAQKARTLVRITLRDPTPPMLSGSVAASFDNASHWSGAMPKMKHMQPSATGPCELHHQLWPNNTEREVGARICTMQQQRPSGLDVWTEGFRCNNSWWSWIVRSRW